MSSPNLCLVHTALPLPHNLPQNIRGLFQLLRKCSKLSWWHWGAGLTSSCSCASSTACSWLCISHAPPSPSSTTPSSSLMAIVLIGWAVSTSPADWGMVGAAEWEERRRESSVTVEETGGRRRIVSLASDETPQYSKSANFPRYNVW